VSLRLALAGLLGLTLALSGCAVGGQAGAQPDPLPANPLSGSSLWVDPESTAQRAADASRASGDAAAADALAPITSQPVATWLASQDDSPYAEAERVTTAATAGSGLPVLVAYHRPGRDCGSYSAGGSADRGSYLAWVGALAAGIGDRRAVVVLEPDAVAQAVSGACGSAEQAAATLDMLSAAVDVLEKQPGVLVYVDAGHAGWVDDVDAVAVALRSSGVARADGFSLNVANFQTTADSVSYGERLSAALGQRQFVVDVSRNGRGAPAVRDGVDAWCNPAGAALGENPRLVAGPALAVAFLWIKEPGASDGDCRPGEPAAGVFWPEYARRLVAQRP